MKDNSELTTQYFDYLISDYKFLLARKEFDSQAMGNSIVVYKSHSYIIEIVVDRNQVLMRIGEHSDPSREWFEFTDVVHSYAPAKKNVYIFPIKTKKNSWEAVVEKQLARLSAMLREYCEPLLLGEIWKREKIKEIELKRVSELFSKSIQNP
jgi:hypothetical protein